MRCDDCGRFGKMIGSSNAAMYDFAAMELNYEHWRCPACTKQLGPVQSNARPADGDMSPYQSVWR